MSKPQEYCGIADAHGIESFMEYPSKNTGLLQIRAASNRQRHAVFYIVRLKKESADLVNGLIESEGYTAALSWLKESAKESGEIRLSGGGNVEESWNLIPNPKLDPWSAKEDWIGPRRYEEAKQDTL